MKKYIFYSVAFMALCIGCSNPEQKSIQLAEPQEKKTVETAPPTIIFNLESLQGKNIDKLRSILGKPTDGVQTNPTVLQRKLGIREWTNNFEKGGYNLLVTYDDTSRKVISFFITTNDPSGSTKDIELLKQILNIQNSTNFNIKPVVSLKDTSTYTGIVVTPM